MPRQISEDFHHEEGDLEGGLKLLVMKVEARAMEEV
jgi:hypothetical protein